MNPYSNLGQYCYWSSAVAGVPPFALDPVVRSAFELSVADKVATAGSCFAQNIARRLSARGLTYYVVEPPPPGLSPADAKKRNYGTYSARYGNIYTTKQLVQLFDRAFDAFKPEIAIWAGRRGGFVDPFRPRIEEAEFPSQEALERDRALHLAQVRRMFETLDVFIFTLGLTEGWRFRKDGAALPLAPGVAGGEWDDADYEFVNSSVAEVTQELLEFIDRLRAVNKSARVILTVSPVPLIATYEDRHVLLSTTYSKSVLRVAAQEATARRSLVQYFPAYEIVTANANSHRYFEDDLRSMNKQGVDHVMRVFFRHFTPEAPTTAAATRPMELKREIADVADIVCEEDLLTQHLG
jgi:hypothetical protein